MRQKVNDFALSSFSITEEQLICMVYAPFTEGGKNLKIYLEREQPHLLPRLDEIHTLLAQALSGEDLQPLFALAGDLYKISGLNLEQLRTCYKSSLLGKPTTEQKDIIALVFERDPHQAKISTYHSPDGPIVYEIISGR